ncbi:DUF6003 family protein [Streptomyces ziwulingensis]|uniref:Uncharacterized protein n=1 Tax=Streptomyces ziwulingensis TaxID=1045501 RepID=A0ABP9BYG7_9ACTN
MTDDAYLILLNDTTGTLGVPPASVGTPACMDTPAVRAWLDAQGAAASSPKLRLVTPEETAAIPEDVERLPVPLGDEELSLLHNASAPRGVADLEAELMTYRTAAQGRDGLLTRALAAGVPAYRIAELTGVDLAEVRAAAR